MKFFLFVQPLWFKVRLKAHHLSFQTHVESYVLDTFSCLYPILIFKCFFQWRTVYKVIKTEIFSKLLHFWKLCSIYKFTAESKWNQEAKKCPILIIICAFERLGHAFSNAQRIISIGHFFAWWYLFDSTVNLYLAQDFQKWSNFENISILMTL